MVLLRTCSWCNFNPACYAKITFYLHRDIQQSGPIYLPFFHFQRFCEKGRLSMSYLFSTCARSGTRARWWYSLTRTVRWARAGCRPSSSESRILSFVQFVGPLKGRTTAIFIPKKPRIVVLICKARSFPSSNVLSRTSNRNYCFPIFL
jgi:hypothetical protein